MMMNSTFRDWKLNWYNIYARNGRTRQKSAEVGRTQCRMFFSVLVKLAAEVGRSRQNLAELSLRAVFDDLAQSAIDYSDWQLQQRTDKLFTQLSLQSTTPTTPDGQTPTTPTTDGHTQPTPTTPDNNSDHYDNSYNKQLRQRTDKLR